MIQGDIKLANSKEDKELEKMYRELRDLRETRDSMKDDRNDLLLFFVGLLMLAGGLFMIFNNLSVTSSWGGSFWHIGSFSFPNGMVMFPLIVGIAMLFLMKRKIFGWVVLAVGVVIILLSVLLSTRIYWKTTSAYIFIIMFGLTAAGAGLVLRELFKKR